MSEKKVLRDAGGRRIGTEEVTGDHVLLRDGGGRRLGTWRETDDVVRDGGGRRIGRGRSLLGTLLQGAKKS